MTATDTKSETPRPITRLQVRDSETWAEFAETSYFSEDDSPLLVCVCMYVCHTVPIYSKFHFESLRVGVY